MLHNPYEDALRGLGGSYRPRPGTQLLDPDEFTQEPLSPGADPGSLDPSIQNYLYQNRLKQELQERQFGAARTGDRNEALALQGLLGQADERIAENPLTRQAAEVDAYRQRRQAAVEQGFGGEVEPVQAANKYRRYMEEAKIRGPEAVQRISGAADIARQVEASRGALAQQQEQSRGSLAVAESQGAQSQAFQNMLNQARQSGANVSGMTLPGRYGGGSVRYSNEETVPPNLLRDLTAARQAVTLAGETKGWATDPFHPNDPTPEKIALETAISNAIIRHPAPAALKEFSLAVSKDARTANLSLEQVLQVTGEDQLSEVEKGYLQDLLLIIRGK